MNIYKAAGMLIGFVLGILVVAVFMKLARIDKSSKCKFDERQSEVRGRAFKYSFFTLLIYDAVYGLAEFLMDRSVAEPLAAMVLGICLAVGVYAVYCIMHDAYFSLNERPVRIMVLLGFGAIFNVVGAVMNIRHGGIVTQGALNFRSINLSCAALFVVVFAALGIKKFGRTEEAE